MTLFALSVLVALITYNITNQSIFKPLREYICNTVCKGNNDALANKLITCHYCLSHWVSAFVVVVSRYTLTFTLIGWMDLLLTIGLVVFISQFIMLALDWSIDAMNSFNRIFLRERKVDESELWKKMLN